MTRDKIKELFAMLGSKKIVDRGDWVSGSCPFAPWTHASGTDRHPSFGISVGSTSVYHCYSCQKKHALHMLPTLLWQLSGTNRPELRDFITANENVFITEVKKDSKTPVAQSESILEQFSYRPSYGHITKESVDLWGLRFDEKENRMIIPIRDRFGRLIGVRGRSLKKDAEIRYLTYSHLGTDGKSAGNWFGMHFPLVPNKYLVLVEGERDAILLKQFGVKNVWGAIGASLSKRQIEEVRKVSVPILILFDNDLAGKMATKKVISSLFGLTPLYVLSNYYGCKDAAELVETRNAGRALHLLDLVHGS